MELIFSQPGALSTLSLTGLCGSLGNHDIQMSKQAFDKRINENTVCFLQQIYNQLFERQSNMILTGIQLKSSYPFNRLRIIDGTTITLSKNCSDTYPGTVGSGVKYQVEFDYLTGRFLYIGIHSGKAADCPAGMERLKSVQKDDLFLQDLGYFKFEMLKQIGEAGAFFVSRAKSDTMFHTDHPSPVYHPNGDIIQKYAFERLLLEDVLPTMKRGEFKEYPSVYMGRHVKLPTRVVLYRMTREEQNRQNHRIVRRSQTKPGEIKQKSKDLSGISIMITNLPLSVPAEEVIALYRYRWQIELLFKSWKSDFKIAHYREMKLERWECHLYVELITLLLNTLMTYQFRVHFWQTEGMILSEKITMREVNKKIGVFCRARDDTDWQNTLEQIEKILRSIGRKNVKETGPIGWQI